MPEQSKDKRLNFMIRQLNSPFDDSAFFIRNVYRRRAMLLDCGRLGNIDHSELLSIGDVFVSHTHIDHFYGFDRLIRSSLMAQNELKVYGPEGFIDNVDGKFRGYTWNLIEDYDFSVKAIELHKDGSCKTALFSTKNKFKPVVQVENLAVSKLPPGKEPVNTLPVIDLGEDFLLEYELFDHKIPSVGYRITAPTLFAVQKEKLKAFGCKHGPWLGELIKQLKAENDAAVINVDGDNFTAADLKEKLIEIQKPQVLTYITDCAPTEENIEKAIRFAQGSTLLIIEAPFLPVDAEHAQKKQHLTLDISKKIFWESGSDLVKFTHFAARYDMQKQDFMASLYEGMENRVFSKNTL